MAVLPQANYFAVDPASVIADHNPQAAGRVFERRLDVTRAGMPEGIDERLPADAVNLVANHRLQRCGRTFDDYAVVHVADAKFLGDAQKGKLYIMDTLGGPEAP